MEKLLKGEKLIFNTFINDIKNNKALIIDIDKYIEEWHSHDYDVELHEFLGLTWEEYKLWVEKPNTLKLIIKEKLVSGH